MKSETKTQDGQPMISVVIPVYNDPTGITATLDSLFKQSYPDNLYEVIVADNGSTDDTREVIRSYAKEHGEQLTLVVEDQIQSPAAARNRGIEHAIGSVLAFIDADMIVESTWLEAVVTSLLENNLKQLNCAVEIAVLENNETLGAKYDRMFAFPIQRYIERYNTSGAGGLIVHRDILNAVGLFDTQLLFGADTELTRRIHNAGFELHFEPTITVYHPARASFADQLEKSFRLGRSNIHLSEQHPDQFEPDYPLRLPKFLPSDPFLFLSQMDDELIESRREVIGLYVLRNLKKIAHTAGLVYEYVTDASSSR